MRAKLAEQLRHRLKVLCGYSSVLCRFSVKQVEMPLKMIANYSNTLMEIQ